MGSLYRVAISKNMDRVKKNIVFSVQVAGYEFQSEGADGALDMQIIVLSIAQTLCLVHGAPYNISSQKPTRIPGFSAQSRLRSSTAC